MGSRKVHVTLLLLGGAGLALFVFLLVKHDFAAITKAMAAARWYLLAILLLHLAPLTLDAAAWQVLFPARFRPTLGRLFHLRWIGEAISTLLPATQLGGDVIRARLAAGPRGDGAREGEAETPTLSLSAATVLVDITASIFAQTIFTITGLFLLATLTGKSDITRPAIAGGVVAVMAILGFFALQHYGMFRMIGALVAKLAKSDSWQSLAEHGQSLDDDIRATYSRKGALAASCGLTLLSWLVGAAEVWVALYALGVNTGWRGYLVALTLESVGQGIRSVMFFIPAGIGVQELGYVGVGRVLGITEETALALSLIRRVRELGFGIPGLLMWHVAESKRLLGFKAAVAKV